MALCAPSAMLSVGRDALNLHPQKAVPVKKLLLVFLLAFGIAAPADAAGKLFLRGAPVAAAFVGLGDIVTPSTASVYWGLRAFSAAKRGNKIANICTLVAAVDTCADMFSDATTGNLVLTTIPGALACNNSTQICNVKTLYDQNSTVCSASACDVTQATVAGRPTIIINCIGSLPCMDFNGSQNLANSSGGSITQPFSFSYVSERTGAFTSFGDIFGSNTAGQVQALYNSSANSTGQYAGTLTFVTASDSAFHAIQNIYNGPSSSAVQVDSTLSSGLSQSTTGISGKIELGGDNNNFTGRLSEIFLDGGVAHTSGQMTSLNSNQHTYWGF